MTLNVPLLRKTMEHIEAHPEEWDQGTWRCKSGMCFAGWAATLDGGEWAAADPEAFAGDCFVPREGEEPSFTTPDDDWGVPAATPLVSARARATDILGLTVREAEALFEGSNTIRPHRRS